MNYEEALPFLRKNHKGVVSTTRPDGSTHSSIVVCGIYEDQPTFVSVYPKSQKIINLRRNPNCTLVSVTGDWRNYAVIEGKVSMMDYNGTDNELMRIKLREAYMSCSDIPHPNWEEYDDAMIRQEAVIVSLEPTKVYGLLR
ncbi:MAG: TIGR03618 family F420-dependent PPOX class oxidoreductase [Anaerolineales bacterium]|jgi:PPOX class probable F420-dependent enzyme|nr:TIGR03618 family F420-dependent PPOX class oxidoreductase [Anaerolineales bacterium]